MDIENTGLTINGIRMDVNGELRRDTVTKTVGMNLKYGLHAPSMETVMNMIPEAYVKRGQISAKVRLKLMEHWKVIMETSSFRRYH